MSIEGRPVGKAVHVADDQLRFEAPLFEQIEPGIGGAHEGEFPLEFADPRKRRGFTADGEECAHRLSLPRRRRTVNKLRGAERSGVAASPSAGYLRPMAAIRLPRELLDFALIFRDAGRQAWFVGGAIRDSLLGRPVSDYDVATDATPDEIVRLFRRVIPTGIKHGTVTVLWKGWKIETTTFRSEGSYSDGRHPDEVSFGASIEEDLGRRDFTINAMAWNPFEKRLADPYRGREDLEARLVRAVGRASDRFDEDGLRILRAIRFASQLGFTIEAETRMALAERRQRLASVSAERIRDEFSKILGSPRPSIGLRLMEESQILELILPELAKARGVEQKGLHRFDVLDHLLLSADAVENRLPLRLAALLHDIGKPGTKVVGEDGVATFHRHEELSARMTETILRRLRYPNEVMDRVCHLVRQHMFHYEDNWSDAAVRRFLARVGTESLDDLLSLRIADGSAMTGLPVDPRSLDPLRRRVEAALSAKEALTTKDLAIDGNDLAALGVPRGPVMGRMLGELLDAVLEDPSLNESGRLREIALRMKPKHGIS